MSSLSQTKVPIWHPILLASVTECLGKNREDSSLVRKLGLLSLLSPRMSSLKTVASAVGFQQEQNQASESRTDQLTRERGSAQVSG